MYVSLTDIVKEEKLTLGFDEERGVLIADLGKLSKRVKEIIRSSSKDVVVEGHYASDVVPSRLVSYVFVLKRDPEELKAEFESRGYDEMKVLENMSSEILDVCLVNAIEKYGVERVDEIDVTKMNVLNVVDEILRVLNGQRKAKVGVVDWLSLLDKDGRLDKILALLGKA